MNKIEIDLDILKETKLTPNNFVILYCLYHEIEFVIEEYLDLELLGYIKLDEDNKIVLRQKTIDLFKTNKIPTKLSELILFVDKYRELFPQGVKSGGYLIKGDKQGCITKFKSFIKKYPEYTQEEILDATKAYLDGKKKNNYDMTQLAHYFIEKEGISNLSSFCEDIKVRGKQINNGSGKGQSEDI